jgi:hypothetical protein
MKNIVLRFVMAAFLLASCFAVMAQPAAISGNTSSEQKAELKEATKKFFNWYRQQYPALSKLILVKKTGNGAAASYRVQWPGVDTFMNVIRNSGLFNHEYISTWSDFFVARDDYFKTHPQRKGIPLGFEYDFVLLTNTPQKVIKQADKMKVHAVNFTEGAYLVEVEAQNWYMLYYKKEAGRWKICDIVNGNEE